MTDDGRNPLLGTDWGDLLKEEFEKSYWARLQAFLERERTLYYVFPLGSEVFTAFRLTSYAKTKVVIVGQDPYHGEGQAHGLAFSVRHCVRIPPSLRNILRELHDDVSVPVPDHGNLEAWARQGVLLLNATLTVREGIAGSHRGKGWERFTDEVIRVVNEKTDPVFIVWGRYAQRKKKLVDTSRHWVFEAPHPSPQSAYRGFFGSKPFSLTNRALAAAGKEGIDWSLPE